MVCLVSVFVHFYKRWSLQQMFIVTGTRHHTMRTCTLFSDEDQSIFGGNTSPNNPLHCISFIIPSWLRISFWMDLISLFLFNIRCSSMCMCTCACFVCLIIFQQPHVALDIYIYQSKARRRMATITPGAYIGWCCCCSAFFLAPEFDLIIIHPFCAYVDVLGRQILT